MESKIRRLLKKDNFINKGRAKKEVNELQMDQLFDLSGCDCGLPVVPCNNKFVKCNRVGCEVEHILCRCTPTTPQRYRAVLKEQRVAVSELRENFITINFD